MCTFQHVRNPIIVFHKAYQDRTTQHLNYEAFSDNIYKIPLSCRSLIVLINIPFSLLCWYAYLKHLKSLFVILFLLTSLCPPTSNPNRGSFFYRGNLTRAMSRKSTQNTLKWLAFGMVKETMLKQTMELTRLQLTVSCQTVQPTPVWKFKWCS